MFQFPFSINPLMSQMQGMHPQMGGPLQAASQLSGMQAQPQNMAPPAAPMAAAPPSGSSPAPQGIFQQLMGGQSAPPMGPGAQTPPAQGGAQGGLPGIFQQLRGMMGPGQQNPSLRPDQLFQTIGGQPGSGADFNQMGQNPQATPGMAAPQLPSVAANAANSGTGGAGIQQAIASLLGGAGAGAGMGALSGGGGSNGLMSLLATLGGGMGGGQLMNLFGGK